MKKSTLTDEEILILYSKDGLTIREIIKKHHVSGKRICSLTKKHGAVRKLDEKRRCYKCKVRKPIENFYNNKSHSRGKGYICKLCNTVESRDSMNHLSKYKINKEKYFQMLEEQNGVCAICNQKQRGAKGNSNKLCVDHNHETGKVRGLLCSFCNRFLGFIETGDMKIEKYYEYLSANN